MEIKWFGQSCFEVKTKEATLVFDPYSKEIGLKLPKLTADVVLVSHQHSDHNNVEAVLGTSKDKKPFVISNPGEYEVSGVYILGISSFHDKSEGSERGLNTIYNLDVEDIRLCHLGDLGHKLSNGELEKIGDVDILLVPVGGKYTIGAADAASAINQIDPKIVIPMHYKIPGLTVDIDDLENFVKQVKVSNLEGQDAFKTKKADLPTEDREIVILKAKHKK